MLQDLNEQQKNAILGSFTQDTLVLAGAGSGKTRVLTERISHILTDKSGKAESIMAITFTNKAAKELLDRIKKVTNDADEMWVGTFHSICIRLLRMFGDEIGLDDFTILDVYNSKKAATEVLTTMGAVVSKSSLNNYLSRVSYLKNELITAKKYRDQKLAKYVSEYEAVADPEYEFIQFYSNYQRENLKNKTLDFDDIILYTIFLLRKSVNAQNFIQRQFKYIHVDEVQDSNTSNIVLFKLLSKDCNLFIVGDIDQCWSKDNTVETSDGIKYINEIKVGDEVLTLKKHKFVMSKVTNITKREANTFKIKTTSGNEIYLTNNHKCFATQADFKSGYYYNYLMYRPDKGFRIGILSGGVEGAIRSRTHSEHPDKLWFIGQHKSKKDAILMEETLSLRYKIPKNPYFHNGRGLALDQESLDSIFNEFGSNGWSIINDFNLQFDYPNYLRKSSSLGYDNISNVNITMNSKKNGNEVSYEKEGFKVRKTFSNYKNAYEYANELKEKVNAKYINEQFTSLDGERLNIIPVSQLTIGMKIPVVDNGKYKLDEIVSIDLYKENDEVYDVEVEETGILVANDIVTHNCIYGWRSARPEYLIKNAKDYKLFKLEQNYRSTQTIVNASNSVIVNNTDRLDKTCFSNNRLGDAITFSEFHKDIDEAKFIAKEILAYKNLGVNLNDIYILYRTNAQSRIFEDTFIKCGIPYNIIGALGFNDRKEIKDCLAFVRVAVNHKDKQSFKRALGTLDGIGDTAVKDIMYFYDAKRDAVDALTTYQPKTKKARESINFMSDLLSLATTNPYDIVEKVGQFFIDKYAIEGTAQSLDKIQNLEELMNVAQEKEKIGLSIQQFVDQMDLLSAKDKSGANGMVSMMTCHASKGLEASIVFGVGINEGMLPLDSSPLEEERRLMYVLITRAKDKLYLTSFGNNAHKTYHKSRFITEIPSQYVEKL